MPGRKAPVHLGFDRKPGYVHPDSVDVDYTHTLKVLAVDAATGRIVWTRVAYDGVMADDRHRKNTYASPTAATDGRYVYAFFESAGLYAYDFTGKLLWKQDLGLINPGFLYDPDFVWGAGSSPILYRNVVIVQCDKQKDSFLAAYDLQDGRRVWQTPRDELSTWSTPTIHQGKGRSLYTWGDSAEDVEAAVRARFEAAAPAERLELHPEPALRDLLVRPAFSDVYHLGSFVRHRRYPPRVCISRWGSCLSRPISTSGDRSRRASRAPNTSAVAWPRSSQRANG